MQTANLGVEEKAMLLKVRAWAETMFINSLLYVCFLLLSFCSLLSSVSSHSFCWHNIRSNSKFHLQLIYTCILSLWNVPNIFTSSLSSPLLSYPPSPPPLFFLFSSPLPNPSLSRIPFSPPKIGTVRRVIRSIVTVNPSSAQVLQTQLAHVLHVLR
jgi:hypothetical protein